PCCSSRRSFPPFWRNGRAWKTTPLPTSAAFVRTAARTGSTWRSRPLRWSCIRPTGRWSSPNSTAAVAAATALFPPQHRDWSLPAEAALTPLAAERLAREAAIQPFDGAARSLRIDWRLDALDARQVQRWSEALGRSLVRKRDDEVRAYRQGRRRSEEHTAG